ncbi:MULTISPECIES: PhoH family protein [Halomonas]|uniref:PhoH family protein n=1 Tax=Halomonas litopenaei TaxID=2109328 RepID=A0ABX5J495_9GAMM|nr:MULTISPECIES: PhoH family protein [Halomonas]MBR9879800.1 PhoH family protein [Gammaproteobacteria bacterium]KJZ07194.1 PhoH [Halomonas sp. S2151]MBS8270952.1 PhoH family protein [Halomonas litopenaei]MCJ8286540.1 PhoH family protein [Halomonas sp.]MCO7215199.1 PhoH family protein [Halomonas sp. OfavH-34-E]|tara:strand:- start:2291 stop:3694 length:1404 start_codon:yes stop_codon:yes gene_type:complete
MVRIDKKATRLYVLDTNVLIHDPSALYQFEEHEVVIPMTVLEELDKHKNGIREIARTARQVSRTLSDLTANVDIDQIRQGIPITRVSGPDGRLRLLCYSDLTLPDNLEDSPDNRLLGETCRLRQERPDASVILVTKDINLRVKAAALGVPVEDYLTDRAFDDSDAMTDGVAVYEDAGRGLWDAMALDVKVERDHDRVIYRLSGEIPQHWHLGMLVSDADGEASFEAIVRELAPHQATLELLTNYRHGASVWGVHAHDSRQNFTLNLLMDDAVDLVTVAGSAGTGKTFMTLAAAFQQTLDTKRFERVVFTRAPISMSEDIGFLPGTEEEKMSPWMGAFHDNMDNLLRDEHDGSSTWNQDATRQLLGSRVQIRAPGFMRGRTLNDTFLIIDEAQNFTPKQLKSLITRAGRNTKIVCLGNVGQIDTPYLTANTCGMAAVVQNFKNWPHAGHVTLKSVERSRLALAGEELL